LKESSDPITLQANIRANFFDIGEFPLFCLQINGEGQKTGSCSTGTPNYGSKTTEAEVQPGAHHVDV
jgi:hypothetical protein